MTISKDNNSELRSEKMQKIIDTPPHLWLDGELL